MKNEKKFLIIAVVACLLFLTFNMILLSKVKKMSDEIDEAEPKKDQIYYLTIGNSITKHPVTDFWWQESGMASSVPEKDYFHVFTEKLKDHYDVVESDAVFLREWELVPWERDETLLKLDPYLDKHPDFITVQLSENAWGTGISDNSAEAEVDTQVYNELYADYKKMIDHIREKCPEADIALIDDYWSTEKTDLKKRLADEYGIGFISLEEIHLNHEKYDAGMGTVVIGSGGEEHVIDSEGTAMHPGDVGMAYIADKLEEYICK